MFMEIISIFLGVILLGTANLETGGGGFDLQRLRFLIDVPSFVLVLIFSAPVLFKDGVWKDFIRAWKLLKKDYTCHLSELRRTLDVVEMMQKQVIYAGIVCMLMSCVTILGYLSNPADLGPNMAVAILTMFYAILFEMLLLPLQLEAKRRIIDYMGEDTDAEGGLAETGNGRGKAGPENGNGKAGAEKKAEPKDGSGTENQCGAAVSWKAGLEDECGKAETENRNGTADMEHKSGLTGETAAGTEDGRI